MGQKVNPTGLRVGITTGWKSRWFASKGADYKQKLQEDMLLREFVESKWKAAAIADVIIERSLGTVKVIIATGRPGVLIGRGGSGIDDLARAMKTRFFRGKKVDLKIEVIEVKHLEESAMLVAQQVAEQIEKRIPFRRILKGTIDQVMGNKSVEGAKIEIAGRLGGAEMSRTEWVMKGKIPLHTLRADIDFARAVARTTYGVIGVKVWIYKGEKFQEKELVQE